MEQELTLTELADALHRCIAGANVSDYDLDMATIAVIRLEQAAAIVHGYRRMPHWPAEYAGWLRCQFDVPDELAAAAYDFMQRVQLDDLPW